MRPTYDAGASVGRAWLIVDMHRESGVPRERTLTKHAGTWEGISAARVEAKGI